MDPIKSSIMIFACLVMYAIAIIGIISASQGYYLPITLIGLLMVVGLFKAYAGWSQYLDETKPCPTCKREGRIKKTQVELDAD